jgi:hypothetical protein
MRGWAEAGGVMRRAKRKRGREKKREDGNGRPAFTGAFLGLKPTDLPR